MNRSSMFWVLAAVLTAGTALFQRFTGPSYPLRGKTMADATEIYYRFERSHAGASDAEVRLNLSSTNLQASLRWKRFKTADEWAEMPMVRAGRDVIARLPHQPPAGKLLYQIRLHATEADLLLPAEPVIIRFRGDVPLWITVMHVLAMFGAMLFSLRTGLESLLPVPSYHRLLSWTLGFLCAGGFVFGPLMQLYAFDVLWTGWPIGTDLTDNKTAVALLGWVGAAVAYRRSSRPRGWILAAAALTFLVYMIPHSILGSELDYSTLPK